MKENLNSCCITKIDDEQLESYWDKNFSSNEIQNWTETNPPTILKWFKKMAIPREAKIFCAGVGDSNIVSHLLKNGYQNIIANDISSIALDKLAQTIPSSSSVTYVQDDLINPTLIQQYHGVIDVYIDRATLHFFTRCADKDFYFKQVKDLLSEDGIAMIGVFSKDNKAKCCGLDLQLWSMQSLKNRFLGYVFPDEFEEAFTEHNGNVRNYNYLLSQKV